MTNIPFNDRAMAGRLLARKLEAYGGRDDVIVLGLARGGVPVAYAVASHLRLPLDVVIVRKLGVPGQRELAMGAIASGGVRVVNQDVLRYLGPHSEKILETESAKEAVDLARREVEYRDGRPPLEVRQRTVILVDDGLATGASMRAAATALRAKGAAKIVVAVPVGSPETCHELEVEVDEIICAIAPRWFHSVGQCYKDFSQTTDDEVRGLIAAAAQESQDSPVSPAKPKA